MWQLAGRCGCDDPHTPPLFETKLDTRTEEAWLWLSRQVSTLLATPIPSAPIAAHLFTTLKNSGFAATRGGLDPSSMIEALLDCFGEALLRELGVGSWYESSPRKHRPGRVLTRSAIDGRRIPNVLHMLLLTRLVTADIATLQNPIASNSLQRMDRQPTGYGRRASSVRESIDKQAVVSALEVAKGKFTVAAQHLGVHSQALASDMRRHGLRLPLPPNTAKRLGATRIAAVRDALKQGIPKNDIAQQYAISAWALLLIELDQPELGAAHREATVARQRDKHRNALLSFLHGNPKGTRYAFTLQHTGAYDWLREYDRAWLDEHLPDPAPGARKETRKARKDWHQLDLVAAAVVRRTAHEELAQSDRPTRLTRTRLLSAAGALSAMSRDTQHRHPSATAEAAHLAETREQFLRRTIRWALNQYAKQHVAISINQLRRVARLPPGQLIEQRDYVIELAAELGLLFDARCVLAPWHR